MNRHRKGITFYKMHGLGNDFMVIDRVTQHFDLSEAMIRQWGDRHTGVGFDQLLLIEPPSQDHADFHFGIYNTDGSMAQQCGNGTRSVALLARHLKLTKKTELVWQSPAGLVHTHFHSPEHIDTVMTVPVLNPAEVPFDPSHASPNHTDPNQAGTNNGLLQYQLEAPAGTFTVTPVSMGNPHGVLFVDDVQNMDVKTIGAQLTDHPAFPERANIGFCQVVDRQFLRLRVFERGVGETRACGSGACAAVVAAHSLNLTGERVKVSLPGGKLRIQWPSPEAPVTMSGSATLVYRGELTENSVTTTAGSKPAGKRSTGKHHDKS